MGTTVIIARVTGEGNKSEAKSALLQSIYMAAGIGLLLAVVGRLFSGSILNMFFGNAEASVLHIGINYFNIILLSLPFFVLDIIVSGAMRGAGDTKTPMVITGVINIVNIVLNTVLIFGVPFLHIPALGVAGSAAAVTFSRIAAVTARIVVLYKGKNLKLNLSLKNDYSIRPTLMKRIINIGVPAFIEQAVAQGGFLVLQIIIVSLGTVAMGSYQVGINVNSLAFFPIFGFVIGIAMLIFSRPLAHMYSNDPLVIEESMGLIRTFGILEPLLAILNLCSSTLKAAGDINYVMVTSFVGLWTFRVFGSYALIKWAGMGMTAVLVGIFLDFSSRSFMYLSRMNKGKWKYLKV